MELPISIRYNNSKKDIISGSRFVIKISSLRKRMQLYTRIFFAALSLWFTYLSYSQNEHNWLYWVLFFLLTFSVLYTINKAIGFLITELAIRRSLPTRSNSGILGEHELIVDREHIIERTAVNETKFLWCSVPRVEENNDYIFLYQTDSSAHIIPKATFKTKNEADQFYSLLTKLKNDNVNKTESLA